MSTDPVAEKSTFLRMYMSNHPDTLVAYAKWYGNVTQNIVGAEMTAIDTKGMTLTCTLKNGSKSIVRIPIEPPLSGYDDVKPRLLEMKALAQEGLGMIKAPKITEFSLNIAKLTQTGLFTFVVLYLQFFPRDNLSAIVLPAHYLRSALGDTIIGFIYYSILVVHVLESIYTFSICYKHQAGPLLGALYILFTLYFGFPVWQGLRSQIQAARINSVMKVE